jgi:hypothetical protein
LITYGYGKSSSCAYSARYPRLTAVPLVTADMRAKKVPSILGCGV